ncbi:MAG: peptidoglycan DD-metalloendopeptidase family protein [Candidatus Omnitrophota bacterium]
MKNKHNLFFIFTAIIFSFGCASHQKSIAPPASKGVYHRVEKGQTLWRISKTYNVDTATLARANRLKDPSLISEGQLIFIPCVEDKKEVAAEQNKVVLSRQGFIWPVEGKVIFFYGMEKGGVKSKGISISTEEGKPVKAAKNGKVSFADEQVKGKGKVVIIDHFDGYFTLYAHNSLLLVSPGDVVKQGDVIAKAGKSGRVKEPQVYFEIREGHCAKNPFYYLP